MPVLKENFSASSVNNVEAIYETYQIETANEITAFISSQNDSVALTVYSPRLSAGYIGYLGETYYQDFFVYSPTAETFVVKNNFTPAAYLQDTLDNLVNFGLNSTFEYLTNIPIAIAEIFLPNVTVAIMQMSDPKHKVDVYETKYKNIYIYLKHHMS